MKFKKIDLGCGLKKQKGYVGIDIGDFSSEYPKDEFVKSDAFELLESLDEGSLENIYGNQFVEHIPKDKFIGFMNQCYRVLKKGGILEIIFPPAITAEGKPNGEFYADPLHVNAMLPGTLFCFSAKYRKMVLKSQGTDYRGYGIKTDFEIAEANYINVSQVDMKLKKI